MNNGNKNIINYSAADIEKYLDGRLTPREMHDLEQAALDDPFLADALEGMRAYRLAGETSPGSITTTTSSPESSFRADIDDLQTRLKNRVSADTSARKPFLAPWMRMAAAILLLLGLGFTAYYAFLPRYKSSRTPSTPAQASSTTPESAVASADAPAMTPPRPADPAAKNGVVASAPTRKKTRPTLPKSEKATTIPAADLADKLAGKEDKDELPGKTIPGLSVTPAPALSAELVKHDTLTYPPNTRGLTKPIFNSLTKQMAYARVFNGIVLDEHNNPLPGASLSLNGNSGHSAVTDQYGQFSLRLRPRDSTRQLMVALAGYEQASLELNTLNTDNSPTPNIIRLQHQPPMDEVVIVGYGAKRKETIAAIPSDSDEKLDSSWQKAAPVIGRQAYLQYLTTAKRTLALDSTINGTETISFEVGRNGTLDAFRIEHSLSPAHDAGTIRLVKEGPIWQLLKSKKARAVVSITF